MFAKDFSREGKVTLTGTKFLQIVEQQIHSVQWTIIGHVVLLSQAIPTFHIHTRANGHVIWGYQNVGKG